jgi:hypothetical protein
MLEADDIRIAQLALGAVRLIALFARAFAYKRSCRITEAKAAATAAHQAHGARAEVHQDPLLGAPARADHLAWAAVAASASSLNLVVIARSGAEERVLAAFSPCSVCLASGRSSAALTSESRDARV